MSHRLCYYNEIILVNTIYKTNWIRIKQLILTRNKKIPVSAEEETFIRFLGTFELIRFY